MKKTAKRIAAVFCSLAVVCVSVFLSLLIGANVVKSQSGGKTGGSYANIKLDIYEDGQNVQAEVTNVFTFLPSKVAVRIYLYSSDAFYADNFTTDYRLMKLEDEKYIDDLDMWYSRSCSALVRGEPKMWMARMEYNVNGTGWIEVRSKCITVFPQSESD